MLYGINSTADDELHILQQLIRGDATHRIHGLPALLASGWV